MCLTPLVLCVQTLNCMLILNAPSFFGMAWKVIKNFIDPQTARRIQLFSSKEQGLKALQELVDIDQMDNLTPPTSTQTSADVYNHDDGEDIRELCQSLLESCKTLNQNIVGVSNACREMNEKQKDLENIT